MFKADCLNADCLNKERELIKMLPAYLLYIFMGSMIVLLLLEELFDPDKFILIKLSLIIIDFLILCYVFLSILHTP